MIFAISRNYFLNIDHKTFATASSDFYFERKLLARRRQGLIIHATFHYTDMEEFGTKKNARLQIWQHFGFQTGGEMASQKNVNNHQNIKKAVRGGLNALLL